MKTLFYILMPIIFLVSCQKQTETPELIKTVSFHKVIIYNSTLKYRAQGQTSSVNFIKGGIVVDSLYEGYMHPFGDSLCFEKTDAGRLSYNLHYQHSIVFFTSENRFKIELWLPNGSGYTHKRTNYISSSIEEYIITDETILY